LAKHVATLVLRLGKPYMPVIQADFAGVIKGKKTIASLRDAVDTELSRAKIEANATADRIQLNLNSLRDLAKDHAFLFADAAQVVLKANDDCETLIKLRIAEHATAEAKRIESERERIRAEEVAKLAREQETAKVAAPTPATTQTAASLRVAPSSGGESSEVGAAMLRDFVGRFGKRREFAEVVKAINTCLAQRKAA
jgi:hypothetical protein